MSDIDELFDVEEEAVVLRVQAQPGSGHAAVVGRQGNAVRVRVPAPPGDGRANQAVVELLASEFGLAPEAVTVVDGEGRPRKRIRLAGVAPHDAIAGLVRILPDPARSRPADRR
jgi:uncharacterized protein (TIGR00251 family)